jgi:phage terminase small subunit
VRPHLLAWQWSDYAAKHRDRGNLLLHIVVVPVFQVGTLALLYGVARGRLGITALGAAAMLLSVIAQGRGHQREGEAPTPFSGAGDVVSRLLIEQWVTFPRFVLSGGWLRSLHRAGPAQRNPHSL